MIGLLVLGEVGHAPLVTNFYLVFTGGKFGIILSTSLDYDDQQLVSPART